MSDNKNIMVSVCCITYNQEKYIRQCLDSIFMQKTNFSFEVIINDDASSDATPTILREYKEKYGNRVQLILQKENQYSKGVVILQDIVFPHVRGKYISFCEGDDFWNDEYKLQKQFDEMEKSPNASWCTHYVQCVDEQGKNMTGLTLPPSKNRITPSRMMTSEQTMEFIVKNGIQMTSYFIRSNRFKGFYEKTPYFVKIAPVDDEAIVRYCASVGDMIFIPERMSCYRMKAEGSWTSTNDTNDEKMYQHYIEMIKMIREFDNFTNHRFSLYIENDLIDKEWKAALFRKDYKKMMKKRYKKYRVKLSMRNRVKIAIMSLFQH